MANLMPFEEEDILEISLLKPKDDLPIVFRTPEEEVILLDEPHRAQVTAMHSLAHEEQAPNPESAASLGERAAEPQDMQMHLPPPSGPG